MCIRDRYMGSKAGEVGEYTVSDGAQITCAAIGSSCGLFCTGDDNRKISLWTTKAQLPIKVLENHSSEIASVIFSKDERNVFVGTAGGSILMWNLETQKIAVSMKEHLNACHCVAIPHASPNLLASGSKDTTAKVWDLRTGKSLNTFRAATSPVNSIAFAPSDQWVAAGYNDGNIRVLRCLSVRFGRRQKGK
eukprot:TRINITY_DN6007_c0_g1_i3.p2 TRINITY_DN6007_c0_g1~~TRINITY_DN6007_c0_g1_i3.p2  ORF type:complete len:192 (+),score=41.32 TRINITY_DN6007_c0_g1_i3:73-648(+)